MDEAGLHACTRAHFNLLPALTDTSASALRTGAGPQLFHAYRIATGCGTSGLKTRITPSPSPAVSPVVPLAALSDVPGSLKRPVFPPCTAQSGTIRAAASWKTPSVPASSNPDCSAERDTASSPSAFVVPGTRSRRIGVPQHDGTAPAQLRRARSHRSCHLSRRRHRHNHRHNRRQSNQQSCLPPVLPRVPAPQTAISRHPYIVPTPWRPCVRRPCACRRGGCCRTRRSQ